MPDQTKEDGLKINGCARVGVCAFVLETGKLKAEKEQSKRKNVPVHATSLVFFVVPGRVLINASRQKNGSGTGIKLYVRSEQQIYLDLTGVRILPRVLSNMPSKQIRAVSHFDFSVICSCLIVCKAFLVLAFLWLSRTAF